MFLRGCRTKCAAPFRCKKINPKLRKVRDLWQNISMRIQNNLPKDYTSFQSGYQLKLPLNLECIISEDESVRLLSQFVEEMDLADLYSTYERVRENSVSPRTLLKIVLYSYMNGGYSSRSMELNCKRDIRKIIDTTNAIESLNSTYRKLNRQRSVFPSDTALLKALYLSTFEATKKWNMPLRNWGQVYGELSIMYEGQPPE